MLIKRDFYINGAWVPPLKANDLEVINPATEKPVAVISMGTAADIDRAVAAAKTAFQTYSRTSVEERLALLEKLLAIYKRRYDEMAQTITLELGAPITMSTQQQADVGVGHLQGFIDALKALHMREELPNGDLLMIDEAGFPAGVFNLVNGDGATVGAALSKHKDVDMMSFTGSTRAGIAVSKDAAETVKRSCDAPTRMLVQRSVYDKAVKIAEATGRQAQVGDPQEEGDHIGPLVSHIQYGRVQNLIEAGISEGARVLVGGAGKPKGYETGYFVRPTIFADVRNDMRIAREEVFGPVLALIPFDTEEEAIAIANDTPYGLAAYVQTGDAKRAERVASRLKAGMVHINGGPHRYGSPFGGYKQSGNGREGGKFGLEDFLEVKTIHRP
eukprot:gene7066-8718_t